ncbi:MAG: hypothetical protein ACSHX7_05705 [Luteolibacter sp.]
MPEGEDIRGAKALIEIPVQEAATPWGMYLLFGILALLLIGGLIWFFKKRAKPEATAEELARKELDLLERDGAQAEAGEFALAASQVVRVFIERKFGLAAPKRTTEEFLQELASKDDETLRTRMEPLRGFLKSCDMVKFAAAGLGQGERVELVEKAKAFVNAPDPNNGKEAA